MRKAEMRSSCKKAPTPDATIALLGAIVDGVVRERSDVMGEGDGVVSG